MPMIFLFLEKKIFLTSTCQNNMKTLEVNKKIKIFQIILKVLSKYRNKQALKDMVSSYKIYAMFSVSRIGIVLLTHF